MFHKIMVSYDDSSEADTALDTAIKIDESVTSGVAHSNSSRTTTELLFVGCLLCRLTDGLNIHGQNTHCVKRPLDKQRRLLASGSIRS
jgi:hypothetical protein